jgi:tetratricopeptide (TPR) repeat protein
MKRYWLISLILALFFAIPVIPAMAEDYNYTHIADIINIVEKSGRYDPHVTLFDKKTELDKYNSEIRQPSPGHILVIENGTKRISDYKPNAETAKITGKVNDLVKSRKYKEAETALIEAVKKDKQDFMLQYLLSKVCYEQGNYKEALSAANEAVKLNPACWQAYTVMGGSLLKTGNKNESREAYINSLIYNRNNPETWQALNSPEGIQNFEVYTEIFLPLYSLEPLSTGKIRVHFDDNEKTRWLSYSFCKAVWKYEPGYFENRTGEKQYRLTPLEEMESIHGMIWAYGAFLKSGQFKKDPLMERLKKIERRMFLREFSYFDILAPKNPEITWTLEDKYLDDMRDYLREFVVNDQ